MLPEPYRRSWTLRHQEDLKQRTKANDLGTVAKAKAGTEATVSVPPVLPKVQWSGIPLSM